MENTYVVYCEEYYFNLNVLRTILRKKVYNVSYNEESAKEVEGMMRDALQKVVNEPEVNANNEILTTFSIQTVCLEGVYSIDEAREMVIDDDYTWGKVGRKK